MAFDLDLLLPIPLPLGFDAELRQSQEELFSELLSDQPTLDPIDAGFGTAKLFIRLLSEPEADQRIASIWKRPTEARQYRLLQVSIDGEQYLNACVVEDASLRKRYTDSQIKGFQIFEAISCLQMETNLFMLMANVSRPGTLSASSGFAFAEGVQVSSTHSFYAESLSTCVAAATKLGWPAFTRVGLSQLWNWLRRSNVINDGIGSDSLGRALSALSHLTSSDLNDSSSIDLVWILLALESLYSKGNVGLKEQLLAKTEVVLGPRLESKKAYGAVYDFRSRLLHGDVDLPLRFTPHDAVRKFEDFRAELLKNENIALASLIATLQFMAKNGLRSLTFNYELHGNPS